MLSGGAEMNLSKTEKLIAELRQEKGFTQKDVAERCIIIAIITDGLR